MSAKFYVCSHCGNVVEKVKDAVTGTTIVDRGSNMAKGAFNVVDDVLGMDTRETIKGVMQSGVKGALWNGIGKRL